MIIDNDADDIYVLSYIELTPAQSHKSVRNLIYNSGHIICKFLLQGAGGKRLKDFMAVTCDFVSLGSIPFVFSEYMSEIEKSM